MSELSDKELEDFKRIAYKVAYNGFWVVFLLRFVGFFLAYYFFQDQRYIAMVMTLIICIPSFESTWIYGKEIRTLVYKVNKSFV